jgi:hypothetical protein
MFNSHFVCNVGRGILTFLSKRASSRRALIITAGLLVVGTCLQYDALSQGNQGNLLLYRDTVDVISGNFRIGRLPITQRQAADTVRYRDFLNKYIPNQREIWPYYPYVLINPKYLNGGPMRIYPGKLTEGGKDYVLVAIQAKKYTGRPRIPKVSYEDDTTGGSAIPNFSADKNSKWVVIQTSRRSTVNDSVFYSRITKEDAQKYINNFNNKNIKSTLESRYKHAFVVKSTKNIQGRILFQPVVKLLIKRRTAQSDSSANNQKNRPMIEEVIEFEGNNVCCLSPPEGGASIKPEH